MVYLIALLLAFAAAPLRAAADPPTAREIIDRIKQNVNCKWNEERTIDKFKAGDPEARVTGIAVSFLPTLDVLQRAAASGKNLIIVHEPTFYNHFERTDSIADDAVLAAKRAFIEEHKLVIWRFHDHWHAHNPDGIMTGMTEKLGWQKYRKPGQFPIFAVPKTTLASLASGLRKTFGARTIRVVGRPDMPVAGVALVPGSPGSIAHMKALELPDVDVVIGGEAPEWESIVYAHDATAAGKDKALILLGHALSEEAGMEYCARWLKGFIKEVPVDFVPAGEPFWAPK